MFLFLKKRKISSFPVPTRNIRVNSISLLHQILWPFFSLCWLLGIFLNKNIPYSTIYLWFIHSNLSLEIHFSLISKLNICVNICFTENPLELFSEYCLFLLPPPPTRYFKKKCIMIVAQVGDWEQDDMCPRV